MAKHRSHEKEDWLNAKWRPMMGWMYMMVCTFDFVIAPILWSLLQAKDNGGLVTSQWNPLTLQGAGLFHLAMGGILGISAYGRTQEKMSGANIPDVPAPSPTSIVPSPVVAKPAPKVVPVTPDPAL